MVKPFFSKNIPMLSIMACFITTLNNPYYKYIWFDLVKIQKFNK